MQRLLIIQINNTLKRDMTKMKDHPAHEKSQEFRITIHRK